MMLRRQVHSVDSDLVHWQCHWQVVFSFFGCAAGVPDSPLGPGTALNNRGTGAMIWFQIYPPVKEACFSKKTTRRLDTASHVDWLSEVWDWWSCNEFWDRYQGLRIYYTFRRSRLPFRFTMINNKKKTRLFQSCHSEKATAIYTLLVQSIPRSINDFSISTAFDDFMRWSGSESMHIREKAQTSSGILFGLGSIVFDCL